MSGDNYLGNPLIKKSNVRLSFTAEQIQEYAKCVKDPVHFIQNYVKIVNIDAGLVTFNLYHYQKKIVIDGLIFIFCLINSFFLYSQF